MELRNLISFIRAAELQSFSKTAEQLGYSQSAVTMQLKQLEEELGIPLFERIGKRVKLTQAGERFLPGRWRCWRLWAGPSRWPKSQSGRGGRLRIGTCQSLVSGLLPPGDAGAEPPVPPGGGDHLHCPGAGFAANAAAKRRGSAVFLRPTALLPRVGEGGPAARTHPLCGFLRLPLAGMESIPLERLLQEPLYLTEKGISYRYAVEQFLAEQGRELRPFWEVGSTDVITRFLLAGEGISLLPEFVVREHLEKGELVVLHPQCPPILMWSQLVYHRNKYVTPLMALFLDLMKQRLQGEGA